MAGSAPAVAGSATELLPEPSVLAAPRRRILVTGGNGMLARDLAPALAAAGHEVFARPKSDLDVTREEDVARAFRELRPEAVVNCAAFTKVDACETEPAAREINAGGPQRLARWCARAGVPLAEISTDFVFDGEKREPYREEDPPAPISEYGRGKREGEEAVLGLPNGLVIRSSWLFGNAGWNFVEAILKQVHEGKSTLRVVRDQLGKPTGTPDLAEAIVALLEASAVGVFHFANAGEVSWYDFAREILELSGRDDVAIEPIDSASLGRPAKRPAYSVLDTSKYERVTGARVRHHRDALVAYLARRGAARA
ncbi:MAG TPA: dTDP-4-dehydrorhamnose reductase [Thermoanaerobaculia bacterium]